MKMLGRLGWRGQCACCDGPKERKAIRAEENQQWRRENTVTTRWAGDEPDEPVVCTWHRRYLPCRRCDDDPREGSWSSELSAVLAVERFQKGLDDDE